MTTRDHLRRLTDEEFWALIDAVADEIHERGLEMPRYAERLHQELTAQLYERVSKRTERRCSLASVPPGARGPAGEGTFHV